MSANPSELDSLRQRITELEAELEKKNAELEDERRRSDNELMKQINELRNEKAVLHAKNYDLEIEVAKLRKDHGSRIEELEKKACEVEQASSVVAVSDSKEDQPSDACSAEDGDGKVFLLKGFKKGASGDQTNNANAKLTEDDPINAFFIEQHKKSVGEDIRQRNREKKLALKGELQRELDVPVDSTAQNTASVTSHERKNGQGLIQEISSGIDSLDSTQDHDSTPPDHVTEISLTSGQEKTNILQNIARLYEKACNAEDESIKANQAEILCWCNFIIAFDKSTDEITARDRVGAKKAKGIIYNFIIAQKPGTKREALYKKIERARKIYKLFEKIGLDKVKFIKSYSANSISKFTNEEIQRIIDYFIAKPNMDFTDDPKEITDQDNSNDVDIDFEDINIDFKDINIDFKDIFPDEPVGSNHPITNVNVAKTSVNDFEDLAEGAIRKILDDSFENEESQDEALSCSSSFSSSSSSDSDSDYDESMEQLHDELTRKEMERLKAKEANAGGNTGKSAPPIKIFDDLKLLDDDLFSGEPVDSNHPINTRSEGIAVQA